LTIAQRPEIRQAQAAVQGMSAKLELAKRDWIPDPEITVQAQRYNSGSQLVSELNAGVSISLPWINRSKYRAAEDAARSDLAAAQNTLEAAQTETFGKLRDQLIRIETMHHHIDLYRDQLIPSARQTVETGESDYAAGKTGLTQVLSAEDDLGQLEVMYRQNLTDYQIALVALAAIVGADLPIVSGKNQKRNMK
jgi:outer membrane protein TolC